MYHSRSSCDGLAVELATVQERVAFDGGLEDRCPKTIWLLNARRAIKESDLELTCESQFLFNSETL